MPLNKLRQFLDSNGVKYVCISHSQAFTAQEVAASAHIPGDELAKTVIVRMDDELAMVVLPATRKVDLQSLREATGSDKVALASESEFAEVFGGCEVGAMPPFGNLYDMDVYVDESLRDDETIAFNAGSHTELVQMAYDDFERLVQPKIASLTF